MLVETLDSQPVHSEHDSDETDVEEPGNYLGDISENQSSSSSSTASVSDSPPPIVKSSRSATKWGLKEREDSKIKGIC